MYLKEEKNMKKRLEEMLKRMHSEESRGGFTLVELIVVMVILGILAALLIPSLTGYIDKAKNQSTLVEAHAVVVALQTSFDESYAAGHTEAQDGTGWWTAKTGTYTAQVRTLAELPGTATINSVTITDKKVTNVVYDNTKNKVTYTGGKVTLEDTEIS